MLVHRLAVFACYMTCKQSRSEYLLCVSTLLAMHSILY